MAVLAATAALTAKQLLLLSMHSWVLTQEQCNSVLTARLLLLLVGSVRHRQPAATTTTPAKPSKEAPKLENRSTRVETASCKSTHLHMIRKKISTVTAQSNKQTGSQKFLCEHLLHRFMLLQNLLLSWTEDEFCNIAPSAHGGLQVFIIYCSLRRSTLKAAWGSRLCFIHHMTQFSAALSSTSVTTDRAE